MKDLKQRTKQYALQIIRLYRDLPDSWESRIIGRQVFRSGTSVGAQYHEAFRAKSDPDLISKLQGCLQELEETLYWFDLLVEAEIIKQESMKELYKETYELIKIFTSSVIKLKNRGI